MTWPSIQNVLKGHTEWVASVAFSPDGKHIVSGSGDKTIRVWNADSGEVVSGPFEGHTHWVMSVAFSPDGKRTVSGSDDMTIRVWNADLPDSRDGNLGQRAGQQPCK
jgi:WD40 repeat protein